MRYTTGRRTRQSTQLPVLVAPPPRERGVSRGPQGRSQTALPWTPRSREATPCGSTGQRIARSPSRSQCIVGVRTCQINSTHRRNEMYLRSAAGGAFLCGFPSVPEGCAGLRRCTDRSRISRSVCAAVGGICRLSPLWFLVPLLMQSRELGGARAPIPYRVCVAAWI